MTFIYPGSFDPVTNGHMDIIERSARLADKLIVVVMTNTNKKPLFTAAERAGHLRALTAGLPAVEVDCWEGLQAEYSALKEADAIIRGVRNCTDFDFEMQIAQANKLLRPETETLLIPASGKYACVSSGLAKEIAACGGSLRGIVPDLVIEDYYRKRGDK
ncbi:MAG: pantetheine-phosphate adenylyltransferase [Clostridiales bacterium]|jgi:pantetheine-phosphate adenylyltransferase|nr:pantetheine-phosphate adenylyltransferase [Clostridiales bacterium]